MPSHRSAVNRSNYENCFSYLLPLYLNASDDCFAPREIERFFFFLLFICANSCDRASEKKKLRFAFEGLLHLKASVHTEGCHETQCRAEKLRINVQTLKFWACCEGMCNMKTKYTETHVKNKESVPLCWFFKDLSEKKHIFRRLCSFILTAEGLLQRYSWGKHSGF